MVAASLPPRVTPPSPPARLETTCRGHLSAPVMTTPADTWMPVPSLPFPYLPRTLPSCPPLILSRPLHFIYPISLHPLPYFLVFITLPSLSFLSLFAYILEFSFFFVSFTFVYYLFSYLFSYSYLIIVFSSFLKIVRRSLPVSFFQSSFFTSLSFYFSPSNSLFHFSSSSSLHSFLASLSFTFSAFHGSP